MLSLPPTPESLQKALSKFETALKLWREIGDRKWEAVTLSQIATVYDLLGQKQKALTSLNQSLNLYRQTSDLAGEAKMLNSIGYVYTSLGTKQKGLEYYNQSLSIWRKLGKTDDLMQYVQARNEEVKVLNNIGYLYTSWGDKQNALLYFNQALPLASEVRNFGLKAMTLNNIGLVYDNYGEKEKALDFYNQALPLRKEDGDIAGEANTLNNIGLLYYSLGDSAKALEYLNQTLNLRRKVANPAAEALTLNNIGVVQVALGEKQKALEYYNQALINFRKVSDRNNEALTLNNIGFVYGSLKDRQKALSYFQQALTIARDRNNPTLEAASLNNIGKVYQDLNDLKKAIAFYNQALTILRAINNRPGEVTSLYNIADIESKNGKLENALTKVEAAINIIEDLRSSLKNQELRTSFFASQQDVYRLYIDLLMQLHKQQPNKGYNAQALNISERARARSLLELLNEARADIRQGIAPNILAEQRDLQQQLEASEKRRLELIYIQDNKQQVTNLDKEIQGILDKYQQLQTKIRTNNPRYAALSQPQPLTLAEIQKQVLDDETILLQYSLGEERSYLWAVTKRGIKSYELPKQAEIETAAKEFYQLLKTSSYRLDSQRGVGVAPRTDTAANINAPFKLSQMLLQPVAKELGNKRLLIVADGALQYLPFAALPNPVTSVSEIEPLLIKHEILYAPSASTLSSLRKDTSGRKPPAKAIAVIADPVFSRQDNRIKANSSRHAETNRNLERAALDIGVTFNRLPFTREEAEQILALVPSSQRLQALDFNANRAIATNPQLSEYRIVHFATHGILNSKQPELSGIVLSLFDEKGNPQNGFLRLHDVFNLNLPADLVVLSACETGLGSEVKGEGLVGLTRGFMYAGSPRIVVSLWSVDDKGTSELMNKFYSKMLKENLKPSQALRAAQIEMYKDKNYSAPFYWAPFTLQGEWR